MDAVIPFGMDTVVPALKAAMESQGCKVKDVTADRIDCKRPRGASERTGNGGEKVTATVEAKDAQTHVRIWTGKKFTDRVRAGNWSTPISRNDEESAKTGPERNGTTRDLRLDPESVRLVASWGWC